MSITGQPDRTSASEYVIPTPALQHRMRHTLMHVRRRWQLYALLLIPLIYMIVFHYTPMVGAQIAFRDYSVRDGIWGSEWVGLENFQRFFNSYLFGRLIANTITLGLYSLIAGFPIPIILALSLNQVRNVYFKKTMQMVTYAPYFISVVVLVGLLLQFFNPRFGVVSQISQALTGMPVNILNDPNWFQSLFVWSGVWQTTGFATVIYLAALTTIDPSLHEAAVVDGASRLQRIRHIDIPGIMPVTTMLLILNMGNFINIGFEKVLLMQNPVNTGVSEIIDTYVYKVGLASTALDFSYATAIGLFKGVIALILVFTANWAVKRMGQEGLW
ncbi:MAG: sugar ABC transporter permease [Anaerolineaceae bacterium]|nr:sugar ABC transporter permease [Anaerolineaceae bacterium]